MDHLDNQLEDTLSFVPGKERPMGGGSMTEKKIPEQELDPTILRVSLFDILHASAEGLQDEEEPHDVPSPSGVASCRLRQWFAGRRVPRSNRIPVASIKKMEAGKAIEAFWRNVYARAGFTVESPLPRVSIGEHMSGEGDGILTATQGAAITLVPEGTRLLLELKDLGVWSYLDFVEKGLEVGSPEYYAQVQCYLEGYDLPFAVVHAGQADASSVTFVWRRLRKREGRPPPFWLEIVSRRPEEYARWAAVAQEVAWFIANKTAAQITLQDHDVGTLGPQGKFPCGYCGWLELCMEVRGGV